MRPKRSKRSLEAEIVRLEAEVKYLRRFGFLHSTVKIFEIVCRTRFLAPCLAAAWIIPKFAGRTSIVEADINLRAESDSLSDLALQMVRHLASQPLIVVLLLIAILSTVVLAARQRALSKQISDEDRSKRQSP
jgi:hypothetical protein